MTFNSLPIQTKVYDIDGITCIQRDDVAALLADTSLAYANVTAGDIIRTRAEGFAYKVAASGATDQHVTTAGGVKLYVLDKNGATPASSFSAAPADVTKYLYGPDFVTDGTELYNFPADDYQQVIGREYLSAFQTRALSGILQFRIAVWGDSRPAGSGQTGDYRWHLALRQAARLRGYYRGVFVNEAIGATTIQQWTDTHVDTYLDGINDPHLIVFCAGINDLDNETATPQQVVERLDAFLEKIRVTKEYALDDLSVAVVVPVSAYNPTRSRDPRFIEPLRDGFKRLSRKWQVCLIDGYAIAADGRNQRGLGYAADITAPEVIHQNNYGMIPILNQLIEAVLPDVRPMRGGGGLSIESGTGETYAASALPSVYPIGVSLYRADPDGGGSNWPVSGFVQTLNFPDDIQVQFNFATASSDSSFYMRKGRADAWGSWSGNLNLSSLGPENVTPASGFSAPASARMRVLRQGRFVSADGYLEKSPVGTVASGTTIGTIPTGFRPSQSNWGVSVSFWDGSTWQFPRVRIAPEGGIILMDAVTITATRVYLNGPTWITS